MTELTDARPASPTIVAVGMFDGVHRGHQHLLRRLVARARENGLTPAVLTFFPHPDKVLGRAQGRYYLTLPEQRAALLGALGVEIVVTHPFDDQVRQVRAAVFVDQLLAHLKLRELWVGQDFALGYKREGNVAFLQEQGAQKGFVLEAIDLVGNDGSGAVISSSTIRAALEAGDVDRAARWLGRPYAVEGTVIHGDGRGRTIGFATANLDIWDEQMLPANGVYAGWARVGDEVLMAVANVGRRPTFEGQIVRLEAHLLDFDRSIYGERLELAFVERLRDEQRFDGIDALVAQIHRDAEQGRALLSALPRPE
ncbi:MAG: bifunctional riboflavin kinase/FAD synthetase [Chloroflexi bacterium]|nr:bifunctional riboflavin kinase/FAD synthetase [Chloroflexota bacterium]